MQQDPPRAEGYYRRALAKYDEAYRIRNGHYPGINEATLLLILGSLSPATAQPNADCEASRELAQELLERRASWPLDRPDDELWHLATEAEARLLLGQWSEAVQGYRRALAHELCTPHSRKAMKKQAERILDCHRRLGTGGVETFSLEEVFGPPA